MSSEYGKNIKISIFGQSHSAGIGVVIDGLPAGERFDMEEVLRFMKRRAPGGALATKRKEADVPEIISGLLPETEAESNAGLQAAAPAVRSGLSGGRPQPGGEAAEQAAPRYYRSCGAPVCALIRNTDTRAKDYGNLRDVPRPAHADYPAAVKYKGFHDIRGGGHFSGRLTAPLCFAGALCMQLLKKRGIEIGAHIASVKDINDRPYAPLCIGSTELHAAGARAFPVNDVQAGERMQALIEAVKADGDSVGGVIECAVTGLPCGLGEPMFDGAENKIAKAVFGIPAVKGIEFGDGFAAAGSFGSENNDGYETDGTGIRTKTNHAGGILGGLTTGMPLIFRAAFKPTPSIAKPQQSVSLTKREAAELIITGRHDPCIVPRAVPCIEAAAAVAVYDLLREAEGAGLFTETRA